MSEQDTRNYIARCPRCSAVVAVLSGINTTASERQSFYRSAGKYDNTVGRVDSAEWQRIITEEGFGHRPPCRERQSVEPKQKELFKESKDA